MKPTIVLASASPRRRELIAGLGWEVKIIPANIAEWEDHDADPVELVRHNALNKARAVIGQTDGELVLGADTTVALDGHVLNKPVDLDDARRMLRFLSGRQHTVYTGVAVLCNKPELEDVWVEESRVLFQTLSEERIETYLRTVHVLDKAGSYGIQEGAELIIESYQGSLSNIMGLPIERLQEKLALMGYS